MDNRFATSEYNTHPAVRSKLDFHDDLYIVDCTIRSLQDGCSGSKHAAADLVEIGKAIDTLGVREIIFFLTLRDGLEVCEGLGQENLNAKLVAYLNSRRSDWKEWVDAAIAAGADEICFESALDGDHLKRLADLVHNRGRTVSHAFADAYDYESAIEICRVSAELGYKSQGLHDSFLGFGISPEAMKYLVRSILNDAENCPPIYVHLSNLFGHGPMTVVAGLAAGARAADIALLGVGHHSGHAELAHVVIALEGLYQIDTGVDLSMLREVTMLIREKTGIPLPLMYPITGDFAFWTDGAAWVSEVELPEEERVHTVFPFEPSLVGNNRRVTWSDHTVTDESVKAKLRQLGLRHDPDDIGRIRERLSTRLRGKTEYPVWLMDSEFEALCREVVEEASDLAG